MLKKLKDRKGFTLIEIIVVIVILAVLMAVAVPSVMSYINEGNNAKYETVARAVLVNTQTGYAKALANGSVKTKSDSTSEVDASTTTVDTKTPTATTLKSYVEGKTYTGVDSNGVTLTKVLITGSGENSDIEQVTATIKIGDATKTVTVDTNKKVTVSD